MQNNKNNVTACYHYSSNLGLTYLPMVSLTMQYGGCAMWLDDNSSEAKCRNF